MPKKTIREQVKIVMGYVVQSHPNWVSYETIMYNLNCGATKAQTLCRMAAKVDSDFEYQNGDIRYVGDSERWKSKQSSEEL